MVWRHGSIMERKNFCRSIMSRAVVILAIRLVSLTLTRAGKVECGGWRTLDVDGGKMMTEEVA